MSTRRRGSMFVKSYWIGPDSRRTVPSHPARPANGALAGPVAPGACGFASDETRFNARLQSAERPEQGAPVVAAVSVPWTCRDV